ncbi:MAG TPA: PLP-dependent aminotransferase family protein [Porticoccaceae bacterium]|nr:PLP-dependent aminotransferase family protein [Porticoccaceae bacterium]
MKKTAPPQRFVLESFTLDTSAEAPLYRQLEERLRQAIWFGDIKAGERLPATRELAATLSISRNTVVRAYEQLSVEGIIQAAIGAGYYVNDTLPQRPGQSAVDPNSSPADPPKLSRAIDTLHQALPFIGNGKHPEPPGPFRAHIPDFKAFPHRTWQQLLNRRLKRRSRFWQHHTHPCGYWPLRQTVADYLAAVRDMRVRADQVVITAGVQQCFELLARVLLNPGDTVAFEEPAYTPAAMVFTLAGARTVSVPVDSEGLMVAQAPKRGAKLLYCTPASHFPLGMSMSQGRRKSLLAWAESSDSLILEDDYNGEYRYRGRPLTTLYRMAGAGRVIYLGSFSKLLFPALRLGYMVLPEALIEAVSAARWLLDRHSPPLDQAVLSDFINDGHFARHLRRMRQTYARRQEALVDAAQRYLSGILTVPPLDGGLHLIGELGSATDKHRLLAAAKNAECTISPVSHYCLANPETWNRQLILGYAAYSEDELHSAANKLAQQYEISI